MEQIGIAIIIALALGAALAVGGALGRGNALLNSTNSAGSHAFAALTRTADGALASEHLLVKPGSNKATEVALCGKNDMPLGVATDSAADGDTDVGVECLGGAGGTLLMTAAEAVAAGVEVYTAANGQVSDLSAVAGTYYKVGLALSAAGAAGDEIEVAPCYPVATTVS